MSRNVTRAFRCTPGIHPIYLAPFMLFILAVWTLSLLSTIVFFLTGAPNNANPEGRNSASAGLFCVVIGFIPALFAVNLFRNGRQVFVFDRVHGSLSCFRERLRIDGIYWVLPLTEILRVEYHETKSLGDSGTETGVFVVLNAGRKVIVSRSERHAKLIAAIADCPFQRITNQYELPGDESGSVNGSKLSPSDEWAHITKRV